MPPVTKFSHALFSYHDTLNSVTDFSPRKLKDRHPKPRKSFTVGNINLCCNKGIFVNFLGVYFS